MYGWAWSGGCEERGCGRMGVLFILLDIEYTCAFHLFVMSSAGDRFTLHTPDILHNTVHNLLKV